MAWTDEQKELVKRLWDEGLSAGQIGAQVGASRNAVIGVIHRAGMFRSEAAKKQQARIKQTRQRLAKVVPRRSAKVIPFAADAQPAPIPPPPDAKPRTLLELTDHTCRYPLGPFDKPVEFFCGADADNRIGPYCSYHSHVSRFGSGAVLPEPTDQTRRVGMVVVTQRKVA